MLFKKTGRIILASSFAVGGAVLLRIAYKIGHANALEFALSHLGIAAVVAGVVGVLFESIVNRDEYEERVNALAQMGSKNAPDKLTGALLSLLPTVKDDAELSELHSKLRAHIDAIVSKARTIETETGRSRMVLLRFVEGLLRYTADAANTLPNGGPLPLPRSANALAAEILSEQMAAMTDTDAYEVISDFTTWQNAELDVFRDKIKDIAKDEVRVRRVFSRFDYDAKNVSATDARQILRKHWEIACDYPNYELAVSIYMYEHVGTFKCGGTPISFRPIGGDLSRMQVQRTAYDRFDECWQRAIKVRKTTSGRPVQKTSPTPFDDFCNEIAEQDPTWWSRFDGPER